MILRVKNEQGQFIDIPAIKGADGKPFKYEDFTPEQLEALRGPAGADGKTPIRGIDYYTDEDIAYIINEVGTKINLDEYLTIAAAGETYLSKAEGYTRAEIDDLIKNIKVDLSDYYTKEETDEAIANAITGGTVDLKDYLKKQEAADIYLDKVTAEDTYLKKGEKPELTDYLKKDEAEQIYETKTEHKLDLDKKVDAVIENEQGTAAILNNETGGQLLYLNNDNNVRANVSVNDGSSNVYAQLSVTDKDTNIGARINLDNKKAYYTTGKDTPEFNDEDELLTKKDAYTKTEADEKFLTEHQDLSEYATNVGVDNKLESYYDKTTSDERYVDKDYTYSKADVDKKIAEAAAGGEISLDGYLKIEDADKKYATKDSLNEYVKERVVGDKGVSLITNDPSGGLLKFTTDDGKETGIAVNDGSENIFAQIYAKDAKTGQGARLAFNEEGAYYTVSNNYNFNEDDKLVTQKDLSSSLTLEII